MLCANLCLCPRNEMGWPSEYVNRPNFPRYRESFIYNFSHIWDCIGIYKLCCPTNTHSRLLLLQNCLLSFPTILKIFYSEFTSIKKKCRWKIPVTMNKILIHYVLWNRWNYEQRTSHTCNTQPFVILNIYRYYVYGTSSEYLNLNLWTPVQVT